MIAIGCDKLLTVTVVDEDTGDYVNDAVVTATLLDEYYEAIEDVDPFSLEYVEDSNGLYKGSIPVSITSDLVPEKIYKLKYYTESPVYGHDTTISRQVARYFESEE